MGETTRIEWCDHTWNPWIGCTRVSPGCDRCYAAQREDIRFGRVQWGGPGAGVGTRHRTKTWDQPRRWDRAAKAAVTRPFVFCASLADIWDNHPDLTEWRREALQVMRDTPNLVYLLLTKRPGNVTKMAAAAGGLPRNVALGASAVNQEEVERNVPILARLRRELDPEFVFVSAEPLLAPVDFTVADGASDLDWIIVGGESGHGARPMDFQWARDIRAQCTTLAVTFNFKQQGARIGHGLTTLDGATYHGRPTLRATRPAAPAQPTAPVMAPPVSAISPRITYRDEIVAHLREHGPLSGADLRRIGEIGSDAENLHSWALVDLQRQGRVRKRADGRYAPVVRVAAGRAA